MDNGYSLQVNDVGRVVATIQKLPSGAFEVFSSERSLGVFIDHASAVREIDNEKIRKKECAEMYAKYMGEKMASLEKRLAEKEARRTKALYGDLA